MLVRAAILPPFRERVRRSISSPAGRTCGVHKRSPVSARAHRAFRKLPAHRSLPCSLHPSAVAARKHTYANPPCFPRRDAGHVLDSRPHSMLCLLVCVRAASGGPPLRVNVRVLFPCDAAGGGAADHVPAQPALFVRAAAAGGREGGGWQGGKEGGKLSR
mmetsp:Transcript_3111/g.8781  ORF Transcript_3111/g.8781 Transcript_3111/m.8781 type:complete len:160 (-) Transcript_3111:57-536(-)